MSSNSNDHYIVDASLPHSIDELSQVWHMRKNYPLQPEKIHAIPQAQYSLPLLSESVIDDAHPDVVLKRDARRLINALLKAHTIDISLAKKHISSILIRMDDKLLSEIQAVFKEEISQLTDAVIALGTTVTETDQIWAKCHLNTLLSFFSLFQPPEEEIVLPYFNGERFEGITYQLESIPLTNPLLGSPYCAYGLSPQGSSDAPALLCFMGTSFPGGNGFLWTLLADSMPFHSVGRWLFNHGRSTLDAWISKHHKVESHGQSLGGAMAIHTALHYGDKVQAFALSPPGLLKKHPEGKNITVIFGAKDPIPLVGHMPQQASFIYALPNSHYEDSPDHPHIAHRSSPTSLFASHAMGYTTTPQTRLFKIDDDHMLKGHKNRKILNFLYRLLWGSLFPLIGIMLAVRYVSALFKLAFRAIKKGFHKIFPPLKHSQIDSEKKPSPSIRPEAEPTWVLPAYHQSKKQKPKSPSVVKIIHQKDLIKKLTR